MKNALYLGLDPSRFGEKVTHYPIIEIVPRPKEELEAHFQHLEKCDTVIFTSRSAIPIYMEFARVKRPCIVVGRATKELAWQNGLHVKACATLEQGEGVVQILEEERYFFPHSSSARSVVQEKIKGYAFTLYDTVPTKKRIDWTPYETLVFTSPSTVRAFVQLYGEIPKNKEIVSIGPITESELETFSRRLK
ncbi:MAG: uroporphyrinogen-III synthase [Chlamydiales bacterium]|nr:uroporphyrinogen-III synthase [Chlamydiales bacterium]